MAKLEPLDGAGLLFLLWGQGDVWLAGGHAFFDFDLKLFTKTGTLGKNDMKSLFLLLLITLVLPSQVIAQTGNLDTNLLQSLGDVKYHELKSVQLKRSFHIFVDLPEDYRDSGQDYPTIYLLDGGNTFPLMAAHHHYLRFGNEAPAAILVGISYGADTFKEGNWRSTDYTAPSEERDFWGGASVFQALLEDQLLPMIEAAYRSDPARRIVFGHSLGGQFVLFNALSKPGLFFGHIASNPDRRLAGFSYLAVSLMIQDFVDRRWNGSRTGRR
jgi:hypothetical protein